MAVMQQPATATPSRPIWKATLGAFLLAIVALLGIVLLVAAIGSVAGEPGLSSDVLALALPALLAGVFSVLSPCSLPVVLGYFSVVFQERRERIGEVTVAFLAGVGTTMTLLGASFTALGSFAIEYQETLAVIGGALVIGFGIMTLLGKGFSGLKLSRSAGFGIGPAYLYGLVFALGWTTCVGPILGSILTMLLAEGSTTSGALSLVAGGSLSLIYVLGLGLPIVLLVMALRGGGNHRDVASRLRGRSFSLSMAGQALHLHTTAVASGLLLIGLGLLLLTGEMTRLSEQLAASRVSQWLVQIEDWLPGV
jgi:cytochrome c-type biogenesis protein